MSGRIRSSTMWVVSRVGVGSWRSLVARLLPARRPDAPLSPVAVPQVVPQRAGSVPVDPWTDSGYVLGEHGFEEVASYDADALVISSGGLVRLSARDAEATWCVMGRSSKEGPIAVARDGTFRSVSLEDLLANNAQYLVGQKVMRGGEEWLVESGEDAEVVLSRETETSRVPARDVVDENRAALRARTVILVDKG